MEEFIQSQLGIFQFGIALAVPVLLGAAVNLGCAKTNSQSAVFVDNRDQTPPSPPSAPAPIPRARPKQHSSTRRYQVREKIFSLGNSFNIKDESGRPVFVVRSDFFTLGHKLYLADMTGNDLLKIQEEYFNFPATYNIINAQNNQNLALVKKKFTFFKDKFNIDSVYGQYSIEGHDIFGYSFNLVKNGHAVAVVNKEFFAFSDTYGVEISGGEDHAFILAMVIVIDQVIHDDKN